MSKDLLSKLKGNRATFVVHSNHPFGAVAAAGAMMGQAQEVRSYFEYSDALVPTVQTSDDFPSAAGQLAADFKSDWADYLRHTGLPSYGLEFESAARLKLKNTAQVVEENTMRFLNAYRRIPLAKPRVVHESRELSIPHEFAQDYMSLKEIITTGSDLKPYLSRDILKKKRPDKNDCALNAWGFQHLHFRPEGTSHILFCKITDSDVFSIQAFPHDDEGLWVKDELIEIMNVNWPGEIAYGILRGLPANEGGHGTDKRVELRKYNANFITTTKDGTQYLAPGGGLMTSGDNAEDRLNCAKIFSELRYWQQMTERSEAKIRAAFNWHPSWPLRMKIMFDNRNFCIYEATEAIRVAFKIPARD
ncbi:MAG TPA: hypothetical protein VG844_10910 [Terracidiphilus sp.]|nr:hypothetical protein [Terracidiphilus sp.]